MPVWLGLGSCQTECFRATAFALFRWKIAVNNCRCKTFASVRGSPYSDSSFVNESTGKLMIMSVRDWSTNTSTFVGFRGCRERFLSREFSLMNRRFWYSAHIKWFINIGHVRKIQHATGETNTMMRDFGVGSTWPELERLNLSWSLLVCTGGVVGADSTWRNIRKTSCI